MAASGQDVFIRTVVTVSYRKIPVPACVVLSAGNCLSTAPGAVAPLLPKRCLLLILSPWGRRKRPRAFSCFFLPREKLAPLGILHTLFTVSICRYPVHLSPQAMGNTRKSRDCDVYYAVPHAPPTPSALLIRLLHYIPEHHEVYRTVEDMVELIERRSEVEDLLEAMVRATEERVAADDAAEAAAIAANLASESPRPRPVSELRRLFAGAGAAPRTASVTGAASVPSTRALPQAGASAGGVVGIATSRSTLLRSGYGSGSGPPSGTFGYFRGKRAGSTAASRSYGEGARSPRGTVRRTAAGSTATVSSFGKSAASAAGKVANLATGQTAAGGSGVKGSIASGGSSGRVAAPKFSRRIGESPIREPSPRRSSDPSAPRGRRVPGATAGSGYNQAPRQTTGTAGKAGGNIASSANSGRNPRLVRQRSRSSSSSPSTRRGNDSLEEFSLAAALAAGTSRGRHPGPASLSGPSRDSPPSVGGGAVGSLGIAAGRARSGSPRASPSPRSWAGISRSPSPQRGAGGIPRPRGVHASGASASGTASAGSSAGGSSPRLGFAGRRGFSVPMSLSSADAAALSDWAQNEDSFRGGNAGGTLSGPAIEAAAVSYLFTKKSPNEEDGLPLAVGESAVVDVAADGGGCVKDGGGDAGESAGTRPFRSGSFDSVGDVVIVGGLALESHRVFAGEAIQGDDDWLASHPSTPTVPQVGEPLVALALVLVVTALFLRDRIGTLIA